MAEFHYRGDGSLMSIYLTVVCFSPLVQNSGRENEFTNRAEALH